MWMKRTPLGAEAGLAVLLVAVTCLAYAPAMTAGFVWDDDVLLVDNSLMTLPGGWWRAWATAETPDYFPLTTTSFWLESRLWGPAASGYHVTNILLHAAAAVLLWRVLRRLAVPGAYVAAAVFALHPLNVASVAWIAERKNVLSMAVFLLSVLAWLHLEDTGKRRWFAVSLLLFVLALLAKTSLVMWPLVMPVLAWWRRGRVTRRDILRALPFLAAAIVLGVVTMHYQYRLRGGAGQALGADCIARGLAVAGRAAAFYLAKAILPLGLYPVYSRWELHLRNPLTYLPTAALAGVLGLLVWRARGRARPVLVGLAYYLLMLLPLLGFLPATFMGYSYVADHWAYAPLIGPLAVAVGAAAAGAGRLARRWRRLVAAAAVLVLAALGVLTWRQAGTYRQSETFWRHALKGNPDAWVAHNSLGHALMERGATAEAIGCFKDALRLHSDYALAHNNLGAVLAKLELLDDAIGHFRQAIRFSNRPAAAHRNLGVALRRKGEFQEALEHLRIATALEPRNAAGHYNLGLVLASLGRWDSAVESFRTAIRLKENYPEAHNDLGSTLVRLGKVDEAVRHYDQALKLKGGYAEAHSNLAVALTAQGRTAEAIEHLREALRLRADYFEARHNLALTLERGGKTEEAVAEYRRAHQLRPADLRVCNSLAWLLATAPAAEPGSAAEALDLAQRACSADAPPATCLDTLAAAQANLGQFPEAVAAAERALASARAGGQEDLAREIQERLALYRAGRPYRRGGASQPASVPSGL